MKFFISVLKTFFSLLVILTFSIKTTFGQSLPNQKIEEIISTTSNQAFGFDG